MVTVFQHAKVITDGQILPDYDVLVERIDGRFHRTSRYGRILAVKPHGELQTDAEETESIDLTGKYLAPGFIDIHCHGGDGCEFIDGTEESIRKAAALHAANGTRVLYPTLSAADFSVYHRVLEVLSRIKDDLGLEIPGVHLEGPFLSTAMCGAQNTSFIHEPWEEQYRPLTEQYGSLIRRWTYAPERDPEHRFLHFLTDHGILPSVGHSEALYEELVPAVAEGLKLVTHLYNCTSTIIRKQGFRHLGIIESAYILDDLYAEIIADNRHLPPELVRMVIRYKGTDKVCLITDAIRPAGSSEGGTGTSGGIGYLVEDGVAKLTDRSAFAGSIATTIHLLSCVTEDGIALAEGVRMLTETPAKVMGLSTKGHIAPGYDAQFTIFDDTFSVVNPA